MNYETAIKGDTTYADLEAESARKRRRRNIIIVTAIVALLVLGYVGYRMFGSGEDAAGGAANASQAQVVSVVDVKPTDVVDAINVTGTIAARRDMPVGVVGEGGQVLRVLVEPGDWVEAGAVLAVVERSVQAEEINSLAAQVQVARADAKLAQADLERAQKLVDNGFVSKADIDRRIATRDAAVARVNVAIAQLNQARARVGRLDIRAPAAGLVLTRSVEPGQVVGGGGVLFRIAQGGQMEVLALMSESELAKVAVGTSATVTPVGSDRSFAGTIWQVSPVINPQTRQGSARIALPYDKQIRPGGFASAVITTGAQRAPVLPESAILSDNDGAYVYVVGKDNKIARRPVKTGPVTPNGLVVDEGLKAGDRVVMRAGGFLNPGETVQVRTVGAAGR